ncbi:BTB/POZ and MATH domain-containing protein 1-like [Oryza glaberrima]|uniref:BTB/POZ and MATH domain-containing protein 1-like n=1 Tax=Oryza glaberrima TaxID=4538 RepID=UPI00224C15C1|nr:BTB/POZ and MATH domain-containing protein 1-like [Oryza glaberrima]
MSTTGGSRMPPLRSASAVVAGTESGQHLLKTEGYSRVKDAIPNGGEIKSRSFRVGGHNWYISYYPSGYNSDSTDYISIFLQLDENVEKGVKADYKFSLLDRAGKPSYSRSGKGATFFRDDGWGLRRFIKRDQLEKSEYLKDDCFTIMCEFTVFMEVQTEDIDVVAATPPPPPTPVPPPPPKVVVPPSDLHRHLGGLLTTGEGADVTFEVNGKTFMAHRWVLAARSPVFHEKLFGGLGKESAATNGVVDVVCIDDMEAQDFEALLRYMYTDSLPEMKGGEEAAMLPDLVAAANRYKIERLRLVCEQKLCKYVNGRTVVAMLAFAEEHHCNGLKENCLHFLDDTVKLREIVKAEGLENLSKSYPSILKDLIAKLAAVLNVAS